MKIHLYMPVLKTTFPEKACRHQSDGGTNNNEKAFMLFPV